MERIRKIHALLFRFFFQEGVGLVRGIASSFDAAQPTGTGSGRIRFDRSLIDAYNAKYEELKLRLKDLEPKRGRYASTLLIPLFAVRVACLIGAAFFGAAIALSLGLFQFVIAPFSFFAGIAAWFLVLPSYIVHYFQFALIQFGTTAFFRYHPVLSYYMHVTVSWPLIISWVFTDQLICIVLCFFWTPWGKPIIPSRLHAV